MNPNKELLILSYILNIGEHILSLCNEKVTRNRCEYIGIQFMKFLTLQDNSEHILNVWDNLIFGNLQIEMIKFILNEETFKDIITKSLEINIAEAKLSLKVCKNISESSFDTVASKERRSYKFSIIELSSYINTFVEISAVRSKSKGEGKHLITKLLDELHGIPVMLEAGYLNYGDYELINSYKDNYILDTLVKYYENLGFIDINNKVGCYSEQVCMINFNKSIFSTEIFK